VTRRKIRSLKNWPKNCAGAASSDLVNGHHLAYEAWGDASDDKDTGPLAFTYLFRRFGPPPFEGGHKKLGGWILTTQDPDVYLTMFPAADSAAFAVGYLVRDTLEEEYRKPRIEWEHRCIGWLADQLAAERPELVTERDEKGEPTDLSDEGWEIAHARRYEPGPDGDWGTRSWTARAIAALGRPPRDPQARDWREGSAIMRRVNEALLGTMRSLLRPVGVRDIDINVLGCIGREARPSGFAASMRAQHEKWKAERAAKPQEPTTTDPTLPTPGAPK
jgi:hypothetical protein